MKILCQVESSKIKKVRYGQKKVAGSEQMFVDNWANSAIVADAFSGR